MKGALTVEGITILAHAYILSNLSSLEKYIAEGCIKRKLPPNVIAPYVLSNQYRITSTWLIILAFYV